MTTNISALTRHVVNNRRLNHRRHKVHDIVMRDENGREVFRGKTVNISGTGAKISGFPTNTDFARGQAVRVEFLVLPKDCTQSAKRKPISARIVRVEERPDDFIIAVHFDTPLYDN